MAPPVESIGSNETTSAATASASDLYAQILAEAAAKKNAPNNAPTPTPPPVPPAPTAATSSDVPATGSIAVTVSPASDALNLTTYKNADGDTVNIATGRVVIAAHGDGHRGLPDPTSKPVGANADPAAPPASVATVGTVAGGTSGGAPHPGNDHADTASDNLAGLTPQQQKLRQVYSQT